MIEFNRKYFFPFISKSNSIDSKLKLISHNIIESNLINKFDISDISSLEKIRENSFLFIDNEHSNLVINSDNVCILSSKEVIYKKLKDKNILYVKNLDECYTILVNSLFLHEDLLSFEDSFDIINNSYISKHSFIDQSSKIGSNCIIGRGVKIGKNCIIKNNVVIKNSIIQDNVIISDNTTIGSTGFGFNLNKMGSKNLIPQIGIVFIDENVNIGSNCSIDRAKIDVTYIGKNSMIDNQVHIAHNVILSDNCCIAAQTGISGSVKIGNNLICGGQVGFAGHINIGNNVIIAAKSGVTKNITNNSKIAGFPAIDIKKWKINLINQRKNGHK